MSPQEDPPRFDDALVSSLVTFDDLISINLIHPAASPRITLEGLARLQTLESRIDPIDQSSASIMAKISHAPEALSVTTPAHPSASHGSATINQSSASITATTSHALEAPSMTAPAHPSASHGGATS